LTVIANESYEQFAKGLQDEMAEVIRNRPKEITPKLFENQTLYSNDDAQIKIDCSGAARVFIKLEDSQLIADNQLTDAYHQLEPQQRTAKIAEIVGEQFAPFAEQIVRLLDSVYDFNHSPMVENARKNTKLILNRQKFDGKEFKELWKRINAKTFYTVAFNDAELIEKCVRSLDKNLYVNIMKAIITTGTQHGDGELQRVITRRVDILTSIAKTAKYDLIGEIAERANLTRKVVGEILQKIHIQTFEKFNAYPDSFIFEAAKIIESVKAQTIIEHITYNKLEEVWNAEEIFVDNEIGGLYGQNVADARKHIYDKLRYDSDVEKKIGAEMDIADEVELYVKLPSGFYIHTPMGKYNPDWAVILKEGAIKHIYFVAESKGSTLELQLKGIENAKITCARRHFEKISNGDIKYDVINSFDDLLTKIRS
jgi:type III restriction enzyme